jgi:hypothetical protein
METLVKAVIAGRPEPLLKGDWQAWWELRKRLLAGDLTAEGRPIGKNRPVIIPVYEWSALSVYVHMQADRLKFNDCGFEAQKALGRDEDGYDNVVLRPPELLRLWPAPQASSTRRRGRKLTYDWKAFEDAVVDLLEQEGDINMQNDPHWIQAALERRMQQWCADTWGGATPSVSLIRAHVTKARKVFLTRYDKGQ